MPSVRAVQLERRELAHQARCSPDLQARAVVRGAAQQAAASSCVGPASAEASGRACIFEPTATAKYFPSGLNASARTCKVASLQAIRVASRVGFGLGARLDGAGRGWRGGSRGAVALRYLPLKIEVVQDGTAVVVDKQCMAFRVHGDE